MPYIKNIYVNYQTQREAVIKRDVTASLIPDSGSELTDKG